MILVCWHERRQEQQLDQEDVEDGTLKLVDVIFQTCRVSQPSHIELVDYVTTFFSIGHIWPSPHFVSSTFTTTSTTTFTIVCRRLPTSPPPPRSITIVAHSMANLTLPDFAAISADHSAISADHSSIAIIAQERLAHQMRLLNIDVTRELNAT